MERYVETWRYLEKNGETWGNMEEMEIYGEIWEDVEKCGEIWGNTEMHGERCTLECRWARKFENARLLPVAARPMPRSSWTRRRYATRRVYVGRGINKGTMTGTGGDSVGAGETSAAPALSSRDLSRMMDEDLSRLSSSGASRFCWGTPRQARPTQARSRFSW